MGWDAKKDALLGELCASSEKLSASKIAGVLSQKLQVKVSRQAVICRAIRLGILLPRSKASRPKPVSPPNPSILIRPRPSYEPPPLPRERGSILAEPDEPGVYLVNAAASDCRFPINNPPSGQMIQLRVCGEPVVEGPYCPACQRKVYNTGEV
jgi:hypothetical protein